MSYDPSTVAFIDTETCGLNPDRHPIWEIAVIVDEVEHLWTQEIYGGMMDWQRFADRWVLENTRIVSDYDPLQSMSPKQSVERFAELTRDRYLVGANPAFDESRLARSWRAWHQADWNPPWKYRLYDVESMLVGYARGLDLDEFKGGVPGLRECAAFFGTEWYGEQGIELDEASHHTALGDARVVKAIFEKIMGGPT